MTMLSAKFHFIVSLRVSFSKNSEMLKSVEEKKRHKWYAWRLWENVLQNMKEILSKQINILRNDVYMMSSIMFLLFDVRKILVPTKPLKVFE